MDEQVHAPRRTPTTPPGPLELNQASEELLEQAGSLRAGRSARTLTPGEGATLKQTLLAMKAGERLQDHIAADPTTLMGIHGEATVDHPDGAFTLKPGVWAWCPNEPHSVEAITDAVILVTVANTTEPA